ncbi:MAG TPA: SDR family NAD(P)-dependent oxidoreductase [Alphaproteobacteria bacterium]|nr:SDR family NAD(P)-dependent oxidoreductase [Alphaproteobacteria bacterium]
MAETAERKVALVTGSGRNIGRAIVLALADAGLNVVVNGSTRREACEAVADEAAERGIEAGVVMGDVGRPEQVQEMAEGILERFGRLDVLVNNAAIRPQTPFLEMSAEDWHRVMDVDLNAAFYTAKAFLPGMVGRGWGRIINLTGMNAIQGYVGRAPVSAAKHGLWGLTKSLAREFGPHGITANAISPGPIEGERDNPQAAAHIQSMLPRIPLGHLGSPEHIAGLCAFLVSEAGGFTSGQMIAVNGGAAT